MIGLVLVIGSELLIPLALAAFALAATAGLLFPRRGPVAGAAVVLLYTALWFWLERGSGNPASPPALGLGVVGIVWLSRVSHARIRRLEAGRQTEQVPPPVEPGALLRPELERSRRYHHPLGLICIGAE